MEIPYYPGCTLNTVARDFDLSTRRALKRLGVELKELSQWNCCGAVFPLTPDNIMGLSAPARVLNRAEKEGDKVTTLCSFCYNVLKRTEYRLKRDREGLEIINDFNEGDYKGEVKVLHILEVFKEVVGFERIKERVSRPLKGVRVAPYYGCMLLRPAEEVAIDDHESPTIFEDFLASLGCDVVTYPKRIDCCGAHMAMGREDMVSEMSGRILFSAYEGGAEMIVTSCPLCLYNLERSEESLMKREPGFKALPIVYLSQLLGLSLGEDGNLLFSGKNLYDPRPLLRDKGLL